MQSLESLKKIISYKTAVIFTAVVFVGLSALSLVGTSALATEGVVVSDAETKTLALEKENQEISVKIEEASQLKNIESLAESRGFIRSSNIVFVPNSPTFASR